MEIFLSEYAFIFVLWQVVQKLCVDKKWIPPGLSIEILRYKRHVTITIIILRSCQSFIRFSLCDFLTMIS